MHREVSLGIPSSPREFALFNRTGDWLFEDTRRDNLPVECNFADAADVDGMNSWTFYHKEKFRKLIFRSPLLRSNPSRYLDGGCRLTAVAPLRSFSKRGSLCSDFKATSVRRNGALL